MINATTAVRKRRLAILAGTVTLAAMPAFAGGVAEPAPAPAVVPAAPAPMPSADWTGAYGGIQLEYGDVGFGVESGFIDSITEDEDTSGDGFLGGIFAGYRYDFGSYVIGAEIDHLASDIDLDVDGADGSLDRITRLGVEAGYDAGPALLYGTIGAANASISVDGDDSSSNGYFYGVGLDYAVTRQVTVGAELLQHEFDDFDDSGTDVDATTFGINAAFRF